MAARPEARNAADERLWRLGVTRREAEVLRLVVAPLTNTEIAVRIGVSKRTVESHVSALLRKFAVADRAALIRAGVQLLDRRARPQDRRGSVKHRPPQVNNAPDRSAAARRRVAAQRNEAEYARAVQRERESIKLHEQAADRLDTLASIWERHALTASEPSTRANDLDSAAAAHQRAQAARARAAQVRQRLQAEGIDPNEIRPAGKSETT